MNKYILIFVLFFFFSCGRSECDEYLISFYKTKKEFLMPDLYSRRDSLTLVLSEKWEQIMANRGKIIECLKNYKNDTSFTLYGEQYSNDYIVQRLPNNIHALYIIECIIQDDYLFNRRFATKLGVGEYFRNDGLNFIYDSLTQVDRNEIRVHNFVELQKYDRELKKAWEIYEEWIDKTDLEALKLNSPLLGTGLQWYSRMDVSGENSNIDSIFKKEKYSLIRYYYHLDFKIGNRWN